jgi:hypothetical protein
MPASSSSARLTRMTPLVALRDAAGIAKRNLLRTIRLPGEASVLIIQPVVILLLFRYVLGGAIKVPGGNYADYLTGFSGSSQHRLAELRVVVRSAPRLVSSS